MTPVEQSAGVFLCEKEFGSAAPVAQARFSGGNYETKKIRRSVQAFQASVPSRCARVRRGHLRWRQQSGRSPSHRVTLWRSCRHTVSAALADRFGIRMCQAGLARHRDRWWSVSPLGQRVVGWFLVPWVTVCCFAHPPHGQVCGRRTEGSSCLRGRLPSVTRLPSSETLFPSCRTVSRGTRPKNTRRNIAAIWGHGQTLRPQRGKARRAK